LQLKNSESRKNPGRIPEKQTNLAEQSRKTIGSIGRIPEESRKNKQDRRTIPEESRKTIGSIGRIPEESRKNFRIPEKSRKNPGRIPEHSPEKQTNLAEQSRKTIGSIGRIPEESRKNKQDHQKYAVRVRIFAEIRRACENLCNSRIQNPGKIPEESRKNKQT
jgi:hypothetical protein